MNIKNQQIHEQWFNLLYKKNELVCVHILKMCVYRSEPNLYVLPNLPFTRKKFIVVKIIYSNAVQKYNTPTKKPPEWTSFKVSLKIFILLKFI